MRVRTNTSVKPDEEKVVDFLPILVLDSSLSMDTKYKAASEGLQKLGKEFKEGLFIEFSELDRIDILDFKNGIIPNRFHRGGATALNETILKVFNKVQQINKKCLINIFTDGGNNEHGTCNTPEAKRLIQELIKQQHTFSFVCTKQDLNTIKNTYGVPESNILTYENNAEGVSYAFKMSMDATRMYKTSLAKGENVTLGFYSKVLNK